MKSTTASHHVYEETTDGIRVEVYPEFLESESTVEDNEQQYVWAYHIIITNETLDIVQLLSRHWHITDATGQIQEVQGPGVVGEQPELAPGEAFTYSSYVYLETPSGFMQGSYQMIRPHEEDGKEFDIQIPAFSLDIPGMVQMH